MEIFYQSLTDNSIYFACHRTYSICHDDRIYMQFLSLKLRVIGNGRKLNIVTSNYKTFLKAT